MNSRKFKCTKYIILVTTPLTLSIRTAHPKRSLSFKKQDWGMASRKPTYIKSHLSIQDQITKLQSRGMQFDNIPSAVHYLSHMNYYRLTAYWLPYEQDHTTHTFKPGTKFEENPISSIDDPLWYIHRSLPCLVTSLPRFNVIRLHLGTGGTSYKFYPVHYSLPKRYPSPKAASRGSSIPLFRGMFISSIVFKSTSASRSISG